MANTIVNTGIGKRVRQRRKELKLSQEELAYRMGYNARSAICKVERGEDNITTERVEKFAKALSCTTSYLMGWDEVDVKKKNAAMLGMISNDEKLVEYAVKIFNLPEEKREYIYQTIDMISK